LEVLLVQRIAIITHRRSEATNTAFMQVLELCRELSVEVVIPPHEAEKSSIPDGSALATVVPTLEDVNVDFCMALGGDGTILRAFSRFRGMQTPVLGVNFGRVGFLSTLGPDDIPERLRRVLKGEYNLLDLSLLELHQGGACGLAINDVVVHKPKAGSMIRLGYAIGNIEMDTFSCDGMVVSTPAGSTAYNLSTGGPITSLGLETFILSAIAPHTLHFRPLVLGAQEKLTIVNKSRGATASICVDGKACSKLAPGGSLTVSISDKKARLVQVFGTDFYRSLKDKFISPPG
jgi:NAD+ kinase